MTRRGRVFTTAAVMACAAGLLFPLTQAVARGEGSHRASSAVVLGTTEGAITSCGDIAAIMTSTAPGGPTWTSSIDGVITSWKRGGGPNAGSLRLLVVRPSTVTPGGFAIVAKSANQAITPNVFNTFAAQVPIAAGQQLALDIDATGNVYCGTLGSASEILAIAFAVDSATANELVPTTGASGVRLNLSAVVEPDVDHDGFGDISQDACPQSAASQVACPAPDTVVSKKPAKTSTQRKITIKFTSPSAGSTFTCSVDGKAAKPCTSPFKKKLKVGKHTVVITAISPLGIPDADPATVKFKIQRP